MRHPPYDRRPAASGWLAPDDHLISKNRNAKPRCTKLEEKPMEHHLTVAQVCDELGVARSTFYDWRAAHTAPPCIKLPNGGIRVRRADFDRWLASHEDP